MPRIGRVVAVGYPHHITQRGNYRQEIFADNTDRKKYLSILNTESKRYKLIILVYCLMPNHVHFIVVPEREDSMGNVFKYVNMQYSQYFNQKEEERGHLFQGRFFSSVMDERHTIICARYIERNPVRAKMINKPWNWKWSSARFHCGMEGDDVLGVNNFFDYTGEEKEGWMKFIDESDSPQEIKEIREQTKKGRVLGGVDFTKMLEKKLNRILVLKTRGRPKKK